MAASGEFGGEGVEELVTGQLSALVARPRSIRTGIHHRPIDEPIREARLDLEASDRLQRGIEHYAAEVEDDRSETGHP
jgi:hypothetical protein